ncbi:hypothetical protein RUM44_003893 [Polyplax serrata]|uniref:Uncharacterized protein n=1 Tax=Polyplax serrata TaxID=468196 RepID=A0ABR1B194_POLSC
MKSPKGLGIRWLMLSRRKERAFPEKVAAKLSEGGAEKHALNNATETWRKGGNQPMRNILLCSPFQLNNFYVFSFVGDAPATGFRVGLQEKAGRACMFSLA